jgi:peptidyl-tRNA hydrolase
MSPGKIASQCGHAYLGAFEVASSERKTAYHADFPSSPGTKVCLSASLDEILTAKSKLDLAGIPAYLVIDSGCPNFFDGQPTVTALGVGPAKKHEVKKILGRFKLL